MADKPTVTLDELQGWIGREHGLAGVDAVSRNDIRRKLEVYCFDCPVHYDDAVARDHGYRGLIAPVAMTALWAMPAYWSPGEPTIFAPGLREKAGGLRADLPTIYSKAVNTATEWEFFEPLYDGDALEGNWRLVEVNPRETRLGIGAFLTVETTIAKTSGELVAKNRNVLYRYDDKPSDTPKEKRGGRPDATPADPPIPVEETSATIDWNRQLRFGDVSVGDAIPPCSMWLSYQRIVMSVAADRMFAGIHHNREQARASGFADIIFNTRGYDLFFEMTLRRWMGLDGRLAKLGPFRMTGSSYPDDVITCRARVTEKMPENRVKVELVVVNNRGEAARGEAEVVLPV